TVVSTKVLSPRTAVFMAAGLNLAGALLGTEVALTIGGGIVNSDLLMGSQVVILAALLGAIFWNLFTWYLGLPSSSSHALIGGLIGAAVAYKGWATLNVLSIVKKIILPLIFSPLAGSLM
ncbi:MAG: inorganic phosphate transporter, partial [Deltaproteobacteria bacterium]|nr:inorganic phosphate transporter [Deltaproteobacteria bacterium]